MANPGGFLFVIAAMLAPQMSCALKFSEGHNTATQEGGLERGLQLIETALTLDADHTARGPKLPTLSTAQADMLLKGMTAVNMGFDTFNSLTLSFAKQMEQKSNELLMVSKNNTWYKFTSQLSDIITFFHAHSLVWYGYKPLQGFFAPEAKAGVQKLLAAIGSFSKARVKAGQIKYTAGHMGLSSVNASLKAQADIGDLTALLHDGLSGVQDGVAVLDQAFMNFTFFCAVINIPVTAAPDLIKAIDTMKAYVATNEKASIAATKTLVSGVDKASYQALSNLPGINPAPPPPSDPESGAPRGVVPQLAAVLSLAAAVLF